jgi:mRNA interferase RelE/StbE
VERYRVLIAASAAKELERVDRKSDRSRIVAAIRGLSEDPRAPASEKLAGGKNRYRVRAGDFRIVYSVDDSEKVVDVVKIGHRREVHRN